MLQANPSLPCTNCGASLAEVLSEAELQLPEGQLLALARDSFALGTCRRGLTIINYVLRANATCTEAREIKRDFSEHLDSQPPFT